MLASIFSELSGFDHGKRDQDTAPLTLPNIVGIETYQRDMRSFESVSIAVWYSGEVHNCL